MAAPERTNSPAEQPITQRGVRFFEGEPDHNGDQYVRIMTFADDQVDQMLAFYHRVDSQVAEWNAEGGGYYRYPELVSRTLSPWGPVAG